MKGMAATETKEVKSKAQRARELKEKYESLVSEAKDEQLALVQSALTELAGLGFEYKLVPMDEYLRQNAPQMPKSAPRATRAAPKAPQPAPGPSANYEADKHCPVCKEQGHDGRKHRQHKGPFTNEELATLGLLPPELPIPAKA